MRVLLLVVEVVDPRGLAGVGGQAECSGTTRTVRVLLVVVVDPRGRADVGGQAEYSRATSRTSRSL